MRKFVIESFSSRSFWLLILILLVVNLFSPKGIFRLLMMKQEIIRLQSQSKVIEKDIQLLKTELANFKKSPVAKERAIRSELGLLLPNEWSVEFPVAAEENEAN